MTPTDTILTYDPADVLHPHERWLREHNLITRDYIDHRNGGVECHSLNAGKRYLVANRAMTNYAAGDSLEEAEYEFCCRHRISWWKLEGWNRAMDTAAPSRAQAESGVLVLEAWE